MATQGGNSRLAQMQMRFQQKQQQEREQRRVELTGPSKSSLDADDTKSINSSSFAAGKVRQMFDERRKVTGIDKSYPLKPIVNRTTPGTAASRTTTTTTTTTVRKQVGAVKQTNGRMDAVKTESKRTTTTTRSLNGTGSSFTTSEYSTNNHDFLDNETMPASPDFLNGNEVPDFAKLSIEDSDELNGNFAMGDSNNNDNIISSSSKTDSASSIKLKPVITKKTAPLPSRPTGTPTPAARLSTTRTPISRPSPMTATRPKPVVKTPPRSAASVRSTPSSSSSASSTPKLGSPAKIAPRPASGPVPDNMIQCSICGRNFNNDRIEKHQQICQKTATKKRKVFDAVKHRVQGTEIEQYVRKATKTNVRGGASKAATGKAAAAPAAAAGKKNDWRRKHEEFIAAIRAAKEMKAHLARGGKLSDLPPPPPSENPDYIKCPHCQRRFNEGAATRHIPKCADMMHNKPKPGAKAPPKRR